MHDDWLSFFLVENVCEFIWACEILLFFFNERVYTRVQSCTQYVQIIFKKNVYAGMYNRFCSMTFFQKVRTGDFFHIYTKIFFFLFPTSF